MSAAEIDLAAMRSAAEDALAITSLAYELGFEGWDLPDLPSELLDHFAAFDPPAALALLDRLERAEAATPAPDSTEEPS